MSLHNLCPYKMLRACGFMPMGDLCGIAFDDILHVEALCNQTMLAKPYGSSCM